MVRPAGLGLAPGQFARLDFPEAGWATFLHMHTDEMIEIISSAGDVAYAEDPLAALVAARTLCEDAYREHRAWGHVPTCRFVVDGMVVRAQVDRPHTGARDRKGRCVTREATDLVTRHDGEIGYESPAPGRQTGHVIYASTPSWDGFAQCDTCRLPRDYDEALRLRSWRVAATGEVSCAGCRRARYTPTQRWYPLQLRVFRPGTSHDHRRGIPVRVVPMETFERVWHRYPFKGQARQRNAYLLGYAYEALEGQGGPLGPLHYLGQPEQTPYTSAAQQAAWHYGRSHRFMGA